MLRHTWFIPEKRTAASERHVPNFGRVIEITSTQTHESCSSFFFAKKNNNFTLFGSKNPHPGSQITTILLRVFSFRVSPFFYSKGLSSSPSRNHHFDFQGFPSILGVQLRGTFKFSAGFGIILSIHPVIIVFDRHPKDNASITTDKLKDKDTNTSLKPHDMLNDRTLILHSTNLNVGFTVFANTIFRNKCFIRPY